MSHITDIKHQKSISSVLENHELMYSGSFGTVGATHHCIYIRYDTKPCHQRPYRAGPETRVMIYSHIQIQLDTRVI